VVASSADINTQMGAILGTAPRGSGTITAPGSEIDIKGGVDPLDLGSLTLGGKKKKEDQPFLKAAPFQLSPEIIDLLENANFNTANQQSVLEDVTNVATATDTFGEVGVQPTILDTLNDNTDDQLFDNVALGTDLDVRRQDNLEGVAAGVDTSIATPSLGAEDQLFPRLTDTDIARQPTSEELRIGKTIGKSVIGATVGGVSPADSAKNAALKIAVGNDPVLSTLVQGQSVIPSALKQIAGDTPSLSKVSGALKIGKFLDQSLTEASRYNSLEEAFQGTLDNLKATGEGIVDLISNPARVLEEAGNIFTYGTGNPVVSAMSVPHGPEHRYTMDADGNLITTPGWLSGFMFLLPQSAVGVSGGMSLADQISRTPGSGSEGSWLQTLEGAASRTFLGRKLGADAKDLAPSRLEELKYDYQNYTDAIVGGFETITENVAVTRNVGTKTNFINFENGYEMINSLNLNYLNPLKTFSELTPEEWEKATIDKNLFAYNTEDREAAIVPFAKRGNELAIAVGEKLGRPDLVDRPIGEVNAALSTLVGPHFEEMQKGFDAAWKEHAKTLNMPSEEYPGMGEQETLIEETKFKNLRYMEMEAKSKKINDEAVDLGNEISKENTGFNFNYVDYGGFRDPDTNPAIGLGNKVSEVTGQITFGFSDTDKAITDSFYDRAGKNENGKANASIPSYVNSEEGQALIETITLEQMGKQEAKAEGVEYASLPKGTATDATFDTSGTSQYIGKDETTVSKEEAIQLAGMFGTNIRVEPFDTIVDAGKGALTDITKGIGDLLGGDEPPPFVAPADDDQEEAAAQAGGLVAKSVVDDDAGVSDAGAGFGMSVEGDAGDWF
jgi:hypothetical protein